MFVERLTDIAAPPDLVWRIAGEWHECSRSRSIFCGCERIFFLQNGRKAADRYSQGEGSGRAESGPLNHRLESGCVPVSRALVGQDH